MNEMTDERLRSLIDNPLLKTPDDGELRAIYRELIALREVEKAARMLSKEPLGDYVYYIRDRAVSDPDFEGNTWDHPRVKNWGDGRALLAKALSALSQARGG